MGPTTFYDSIFFYLKNDVNLDTLDSNLQELSRKTEKCFLRRNVSHIENPKIQLQVAEQVEIIENNDVEIEEQVSIPPEAIVVLQVENNANQEPIFIISEEEIIEEQKGSEEALSHTSPFDDVEYKEQVSIDSEVVVPQVENNANKEPIFIISEEEIIEEQEGPEEAVIEVEEEILNMTEANDPEHTLIIPNITPSMVQQAKAAISQERRARQQRFAPSSCGTPWTFGSALQTILEGVHLGIGVARVGVGIYNLAKSSNKNPQWNPNNFAEQNVVKSGSEKGKGYFVENSTGEVVGAYGPGKVRGIEHTLAIIYGQEGYWIKVGDAWVHQTGTPNPLPSFPKLPNNQTIQSNVNSPVKSVSQTGNFCSSLSSSANQVQRQAPKISGASLNRMLAAYKARIIK